jgi:triacylglycerol lipase
VAAMQQLTIPIWREGLAFFERAALAVHPVLEGPSGDGAPVLLVPGFLAGDPSLAPMARWLAQLGYRPCRAGIRANVDCATRAVERLEVQAERSAQRYGRRLAVIGQSRGGTLARVLGFRRPDLVESVVCLGSPLVDQLAVHPVVRAHVDAVALLGSLGIPGLFSRRCGRGDCCVEVSEQLAAPMPDEVRLTSVYSRSDGIVDWRTCLDPSADAVEVHSTHVGMAFNREVFRVLARVLPGHRAPVAELRAAA